MRPAGPASNVLDTTTTVSYLGLIGEGRAFYRGAATLPAALLLAVGILWRRGSLTLRQRPCECGTELLQTSEPGRADTLNSHWLP